MKRFTPSKTTSSPSTRPRLCGRLEPVIEQLAPRLVIFSHTYQVRDFAPRLAALLGKTFVTDCVGFRVDGSDVIFTRQVFQEN